MGSRRTAFHAAPRHGAWLVALAAAALPARAQAQGAEIPAGTWAVLPMSVEILTRPQTPTGLCFVDANQGVWTASGVMFESGVFGTDDGGATWVPGLGHTVDGCSVSPQGVLHASGAEFMLESQSSFVAKSTNGGKTWTTTTMANAPGSIQFFDANNGVAVRGRASVKTTNGGVTWDSVGVLPWGVRALKFATPQVGYAVGTGGVFKTFDGGATWGQQAVPGLPSGRSLNALHFINEHWGVVVGDSGTWMQTLDGGDIWHMWDIGATRSLRAVAFVNAYTGYVAGADSAVLRTTDGGITWSRETRPVPGEEIRYLSVPTGGVAYAVTEKGTVLKCTGSCGTAALLPALTAPPALLSPADGSVAQPLSLTLSWGPPHSAQKTFLQFSTDPTFATRLIDDSATTASTRAVTDLVTETRYYWRMRARHPDGYSAWVGASFTTRAGTISLASPGAEGHLGSYAALRPREGVLEFRLREPSRVRVRILDARGALLSEPLNAARDSGVHHLALPQPTTGHAYHFLEFRADDAYQVIPLAGP